MTESNFLVYLVACWVYTVGDGGMMLLLRLGSFLSGMAAANLLGVVRPSVPGCVLCPVVVVPLEPVDAPIPGKMWMA